VQRALRRPLELLTAIAIGYDESWLPGGLPNRFYNHIAIAAYDAVGAAVPPLRTMLSDRDAAVRTAAAYALAWFPEQADGSLPALGSAATDWCGEADGPVIATVLVATGLLGGEPARR
jgi:hypothetical protein